MVKTEFGKKIKQTRSDTARELVDGENAICFVNKSISLLKLLEVARFLSLQANLPTKFWEKLF